MRSGPRVMTAISLLLVISFAASGCVPEGGEEVTESVSATEEVEHGRTTVAGAAKVEITLSAPDLSEAWEPLQDIPGDAFLLGVPVEVTASAEGTFVLERSYPVPLSEDVSAFWVYFSEDLGGWMPVPSTLSADRRTLRAEVEHLSLWNDLVVGSREAMGTLKQAFDDTVDTIVNTTAQAWDATIDGARRATEWAGEQFDKVAKQLTAENFAYVIGSVFDTRVSAPECTGEVPVWVDEVIHLPNAVNNPVLWCVGRDESDPEVLVVKVRANRSFGYTYATAIESVWTTSAEQTILDLFLKTTGALGGAAADVAYSLSADGKGLLLGGKEVSFGFDEATARASLQLGQPLVELALPDVATFAITTMLRVAIGKAQGALDGTFAGALAVATCAHSVHGIDDFLDAIGAIVACIRTQEKTILEVLSSALGPGASDPVALGNTIGKWVGRTTIALAAIGPTQSAIDYALEHTLPDITRQLMVYLASTVSLDPRPALSSPGEFSGHGYLVYNGMPDWDTAAAYCRARDGYLATISSAGENSYVHGWLRDQGLDDAYFGFHRMNDGTWTWLVDEPGDYTNWAPGEPNNERGVENWGMYYWKNPDGTWNDGDFGQGTNGDPANFICEFSDLNAAMAAERG